MKVIASIFRLNPVTKKQNGLLHETVEEIRNQHPEWKVEFVDGAFFVGPDSWESGSIYCIFDSADPPSAAKSVRDAFGQARRRAGTIRSLTGFAVKADPYP